MRVKCSICDVIDTIDSQSVLAKKLINRPIHTYMCKTCTDRITERTLQRLATNKFRRFRTNEKENQI